MDKLSKIRVNPSGNPLYPSDAQWRGAHNMAVDRAASRMDPENPERAMERATARMIASLLDYCDASQARHERPILDDGHLGDFVQYIARGLRGLLNGDTGRLDCGTLDGLLLPLAEPDEVSPNPYREAPTPRTWTAEDDARR